MKTLERMVDAMKVGPEMKVEVVVVVEMTMMMMYPENESVSFDPPVVESSSYVVQNVVDVYV